MKNNERKNIYLQLQIHFGDSMKPAKLFFSLLIIISLGVSISGCQQTPEKTAEQISKNAETTTTTIEWTMLDKDYTFDSRIYAPFELDKTTKLTITLNLPNGKSLEYIGVIPENKLEKWKEDDTALEYLYLKTDVKSGTYTTTLNAGKYFFVIGLPTSQHQTLKEGTIVVKAREYVGIPIDLNNIIYAENIRLTIDIREEKDIDIIFTTAEEYNILQQGGTPKVITYYEKAESGTYKLTNAKPSYIDKLPPDTYYIIFDNTNSIITRKTIDYKLAADITEPFTGHIKIVAKEIE